MALFFLEVRAGSSLKFMNYFLNTLPHTSSKVFDNSLALTCVSLYESNSLAKLMMEPAAGIFSEVSPRIKL